MNGSRENNILAKSTKSLKDFNAENDMNIRNSKDNPMSRSQNMSEEKLDAKIMSPRRKFLDKKRHTKLGETEIEGLENVHPYELNPFEIGLKNSLFFRVHINGCIETGKFYEGDGVYCKYDFVYGNDWEKEDGNLTGESQYCFRGEGTYDYFVYNTPFEISLRSINPHGWPQLVISCITIDRQGKESVYGYGVIYCPMQPGTYKKEVSVFYPKAVEFQDKINSILNEGDQGEKKDKKDSFNAPKIMASGEGREITRALYQGSLEVKFSVTLRDVEKLGYNI